MMKKMWKMKKGKDAVSPVIATILMVAITVVLAAVLYVMVMGFGGESSDTPTGSFSQADTSANYGVNITFAKITPISTPSEFTIIVDGTSFDWDGDSWGTIAYTDLVDDNQIAQGDFITVLDAALDDGSNTVQLVWTSDGSEIDSITFNYNT